MSSPINRTLIKPGQRWKEITYSRSIGEIISVEKEIVVVKGFFNEGYFNYAGQILNLTFYDSDWKLLPNQNKLNE
jgi:hypothetical protein